MCPKERISSQDDTIIDIDYLYEGHDFLIKVSRAKFEELNVDLFEKCMEIVKECIEDAHMSNDKIDDIVLVGGSSRIKKVAGTT
ncbi:hypothetical protein SUGI_0993560 [Cryptomeria japonica]|nr:hypothetical protein SUGI_0993560 [Cryptomeria japonica]